MISLVEKRPVEISVDLLRGSSAYGIFVSHAIDQSGETNSVLVLCDGEFSKIYNWKHGQEVDRRKCFVGFPGKLLYHLSKIGLWECADYSSKGMMLDGEGYFVVAKGQDGNETKISIENPQKDFKHHKLLKELECISTRIAPIYEMRIVFWPF